MATNRNSWIYSMQGAAKPLKMLGKFQAGATQAIKIGEILEFTGDTNSAWVPIDSNFEMNGNIAIAAEEVKSGDRAGYYEIIVPRPGDVFEYALDTAAATAYGTGVYYSASQTVTATAGVGRLGTAVGQRHYPQRQGHLADDASGDMGTTIKSTAYVEMTFSPTASLYCLLERSDRTADIGDAGGYCGFIWTAATTDLRAYVDGTVTASLEATGTWTDEVS